jgi:hypothetical protein
MAVKQKTVQPETAPVIDFETALAQKVATQIDSEIDYTKFAQLVIVNLASLAKTRFINLLTSGENSFVPLTEIDAMALSEAKND